MSHEKVAAQALDLTRAFPASPRAMLAGYVIAKRAVDKCRATLNGTVGPYHFDSPMDNFFFEFAGLTGAELKEFVATGADDDDVELWIEEHAAKRPRLEIFKWNNSWRYRRISECPDKIQLFLETYIPRHVPVELRARIVYIFDVFDAEEQRLQP